MPFNFNKNAIKKGGGREESMAHPCVTLKSKKTGQRRVELPFAASQSNAWGCQPPRRWLATYY